MIDALHTTNPRLDKIHRLPAYVLYGFSGNPYHPYLSLIGQAITHCQNSLRVDDSLLASKHAAVARSLLEALR